MMYRQRAVVVLTMLLALVVPSLSKSSKKYSLLEYEDELAKFVDQHHAFSMPTDPPAKGKGKGFSPAPNSKGKGKGYPSKGKGKKSKSGKKDKSDAPYYSKGKGKGKGYSKGKGVVTPTLPPGHTPAPQMASNSTGEPTAAPSMSSVSQQSLTSAPTVAGPTIVSTQYKLIHTGSATNPSDTDIDSMSYTTSRFLNDFFKENFGVGGTASVFRFVKAETKRTEFDGTGHSFVTTLHFLVNSQVPPVEDVDEAVAFAFENPSDRADYVIDLRSLQGTAYESTTGVIFRWNPAVTATDVTPTAPAASPIAPPTDQAQEQDVVEEPETVTASESSSSSDSSSGYTVPAAGAAGAGVFALMVGGLLMARRRRRGRDESSEKFLDHDGHITVAGETYAGETYMGSSLGDYATEPNAYSCNPRSSAAHNDNSSVGSADWDQFQRNPGSSESSQQEWDHMNNALSAGRPPSPPADPWTATNKLPDVMEDDYEEEEDDDESERFEEKEEDDDDDEHSAPGPMQDVRL